MEISDARALIEADEQNAMVLFPYLNGQDVNSRPDCSASRWVINFHDWPENRAKAFPEVFQIVVSRVRPERQRRKPDGSYALRRPLPERYWQYADKRTAMTSAIRGLERVIVITIHTKTVMPVLVSAGASVFTWARGFRHRRHGDAGVTVQRAALLVGALVGVDLGDQDSLYPVRRVRDPAAA